MTGIKAVDSLFLFGFGTLAILIIVLFFFLFALWKFHKTPKELRGINDTKVDYFVLFAIVISLLLKLVQIKYYSVSVLSFLVSVLFLIVTGWLIFIKKAKLSKSQSILTGVLVLYSLITIIIYFTP